MENRSIRVLVLVPNLRVSNGVASFAMNYFRALDHQHIHMDFGLFTDVPTPYYKEIEEAGSRYFVFPSLKTPLAHIRECRKILRSEQYDIVHNNTLLPAIPLMHIAKQIGTPVRLLHIHSTKLGETVQKERRNKLFIPLLFNSATDFVACSNVAAQALPSLMEGNYEVIPNIISKTRLSFSAEKRKQIRTEMNADHKIIIGTVGRVAAPKNPLFALAVIEKVIKALPDVEYWWIGSGSMDQVLKDRVIELNLEKHVKVLGSREDVADLYQAMDIFFLPSLFEGLPVTGVESQAMGLPAVISDTVTNEMVYTDLVQFVSLDDPVEKWVQTFKDQIKRIPERRSYAPELQKSMFCADYAGMRLENLYIKLLRQAQ